MKRNDIGTILKWLFNYAVLLLFIGSKCDFFMRSPLVKSE